VSLPFSEAIAKESAFATLRRFAQKRPTAEFCEMCSTALPVEHQHLIDPAARKLVCACDACAILFSNQSSTKFKRVPRRIRFLPDFQMTDAQWEALMIPIDMAFFFKRSGSGKVAAFYPGPAGATESLLSLETWAEIEKDNSAIGEMEPDVQALLVNRVGTNRGVAAAQYYIVPIDECYKLVGLIRLHWHGLSGGTEVWREVGKLFSKFRDTAEIVAGKPHA
jgi:hypothetical protein